MLSFYKAEIQKTESLKFCVCTRITSNDSVGRGPAGLERTLHKKRPDHSGKQKIGQNSKVGSCGNEGQPHRRLY